MPETTEQPTQQHHETVTPMQSAPERSLNVVTPASKPDTAVSVLTHGWKAYAAEQVQKGRWIEEKLKHPERKLLPEMNSKEIKQGIREGIITEPDAVTTMLERELEETRLFWGEWQASHAAERDDSLSLARSEIAAKEEELRPLLKNPTRQATYLATQAETALIPEEGEDPIIVQRKQTEAAFLFEMAARLARLAAAEQQQKNQQQAQEVHAQEDTEAKLREVQQQITAIDSQEQPKAA